VKAKTGHECTHEYVTSITYSDVALNVLEILQPFSCKSVEV